MTPANAQKAWLFTFAERSLIGFAERIEQNIPDVCVFAKMGIVPKLSDRYGNCTDKEQDFVLLNKKIGNVGSLDWLKAEKSRLKENVTGNMMSHQEIRLGLFRERILAAFG